MNSSQKVVVVGTGMVGASYAYSLVNQGLVNELVLLDINGAAAEAHAEDIIHGTCFLPTQPKIYAGTYDDCKDAGIVCITAGAAQKPGQSRLDLVETNERIMTSIVNDVMASGFDGILLIASNPVDIMAYVAMKVSGLPRHRVIGSGTTLDTARFRSNLAKYLNYNPTNIHAYIIGEHGDSSLPLWSTATVGQKPLLELVGECCDKTITKEGLDECFTSARDAAYKIIEGKGSTYFGIGVALSRITKAIFSNQKSILTCGVYLEGEYYNEDVYIPVPAIIGSNGVEKIQALNITAFEQKQLDKSIESLKGIISHLKVNETKTDDKLEE